jgi:hypothetical protein
VGRAGAPAGHLRLPRARRRPRPRDGGRGDGPRPSLPAGAARDDRQLTVPRRRRHRPRQLPHDVVVAVAHHRPAGVPGQRREVPRGGRRAGDVGGDRRQLAPLLGPAALVPPADAGVPAR